MSLKTQEKKTDLVRPLPPDNDERRKAALTLDQNMIVLAGAGTGKTTLLIDRLVLLILGKEIPIERIVALTFTKKAAEEMRERLEARLRDIIKDPGCFPLLLETFPETQSHWETTAKKALEDIPKAQIGTIHSFAGHLLRLFPVQAKVDPSFREDQGEVQDQIFEDTWRAWLHQEWDLKSPRASLWRSLLLQVSLDDLKELAKELVSPAVDLASLEKKFDLKQMRSQWKEEFATLLNQHSIPSRARAFAAGLNAIEQVFDGEIGSEDVIEAVERFAPDRPPQDWLSAKTQLKEFKRRAKALLWVNGALMNQVLEALLPLITRVQTEMARQGVVSFEGLLVFARNLLRDHFDVRAEVKKRFDVFLVDEFQDTDPLQGEILFYCAEIISGHANAWQDIQLDPGRLFVVGDPKQSIYRFRGADMAAFEAFRQALLSQGAVEAELSANFRSEPHLLDSVNAIFPTFMKPEPFIQPTYRPLLPGRASSGTPAFEFMYMTEEASDKPKATEVRQFEANAIADWIEKNIKEDYSSVALLFRSANAFEPYLAALRQRNIPYLAEGEKFFYQTVEVTEFLNLLSVLADPRDQLALVGVLRSPLGGLTDYEILKLKQANGLDYRKEAPILKEKIQSLYNTLRELFDEAQFRPVRQLIQSVFKKTWILELFSQSVYGEQALANVRKIADLAGRWSDERPLTLKAFVTRFQQYREDEKEEGENPLADVKYEAVKLMTIHKSKGLEFPVVFLPNLCAPQGAQASKPILIRDWRTGLVGLRLRQSRFTNGAMVLLEEEIRAREKAEEIRVLYVAMTRAKEKLFSMIRSKPAFSSEYARLLKKSGVWPAGEATQSLAGSVSIPVQVSAWKKMNQAQPLIRRKHPLEPDWKPESLAKQWLKREEEFQALAHEPQITSPTSQMKKEAQEPDKWRVIEEESLVSDPTAIQIGLVCHKILEEWDFSQDKSQFKSSLTKALTSAAKLFGLLKEKEADQAVLKESEEILLSFFASSPYKTLSKSHIVGREWPFLYPMKSSGPAVMRGVMDLLYEANGELVIADYKTTRLGKKTIQAVASHYKTQAKAYKTAIQKALNQSAKFELIFLREGVSYFL